MTLTAAGEILYSEVQGLTRELGRVQSRIAALQGIQAGTVNVYCYQAATEDFIAPVIQQLHLRHPKLSFSVTASSTDQTMEALLSGLAEVGLMINPPVREAILTTEIERDAIMAAVAPNHRLAGREVVSLQELASFPLVLTEHPFGLRRQTDAVFSRYRVEPDVFCVTNSILLLKEIVKSGQQCTLLPRLAAKNEVRAGTLVTVPVPEFADAPLVYCVSVLKQRSLSPAASVFLNTTLDFWRARTASAPQHWSNRCQGDLEAGTDTPTGRQIGSESRSTGAVQRRPSECRTGRRF